LAKLGLGKPKVATKGRTACHSIVAVISDKIEKNCTADEINLKRGGHQEHYIVLKYGSSDRGFMLELLRSKFR
jgi:hypothetical protein